MRLTPSQIAVTLLCGQLLPPPGELRIEQTLSLQGRIQLGHDQLVQITSIDLGYNLQAWHAHLKHSRQGGYTWGKNIVLPNVMKAALASAAWPHAVRNLESHRSQTAPK